MKQNSLIAAAESIGGSLPATSAPMRKLTLGSFTMLERAGMKTLKGVKDMTQADYFRDVAIFMYIHSAPIDAVLDAMDAGEKAISRAVDKFALELTLEQAMARVEDIQKQLSDGIGARVVPVEKDDAATDDFKAKNKPGRRK